MKVLQLTQCPQALQSRMSMRCRCLAPRSCVAHAGHSTFKLPRGALAATRMLCALHPARLPISRSLAAIQNCNTLSASARSLRPSVRPSLKRCASQSAAEVADKPAKVLLVYSKPDCPLCDHLKTKVESVLTKTIFTASALSGTELQVRNILSDDRWKAAYQYEIPVLTWLLPDDKELPIPRPAPRLSVERLERHLIAALDDGQALSS